MTDVRDQILGAVRRSLGRGELPVEDKAALASRLAAHARHIEPQRVNRGPEELVALFAEMATATAATLARVPTAGQVPAAIAEFLAAENLPAELVASPALRELDWTSRPLLSVRFDRAEGDDLVSATPVLAAVAETGTLVLQSGPQTPSTLNFLPDTHIAVLHARDIVGPYEEVWDRLRAAGAMPRTVNFVTGPSRTGDLEQIILLGAHGPRRLHIILVEDGLPADRRR